MKNKKNILAVIALISGLVCLCYYFATKNAYSISIRPFTFPSFLINYNIVLINAIALMLYGILGIATTSRWAKVLFSAVAVCTGAAACTISPSLIIMYFFAGISLISLLVQIIDNSPEKKLFFVYEKGDILMIFDTKRPSYKEVYERVHKKKYTPSANTSKTETKKKPNRPKKAKPLGRKYTGYAISPKSKNYRKKAKKKNSKR